jgi:transposase, IS30 family
MGSLTLEERYQFFELRLAGFAMTHIARLMKRHRSSLYDELSRCAGQDYCPALAQTDREERKVKSAANGPRKSEQVRRAVKQKLDQDWSPDQIRGRFRLLGQESMSVQGMYDLAEREGWRSLLRRCQIRGKPYHPRKPWAGKARSIHERPAEVMDRDQIGHWESDTVTGRKSDQKRILVSHERQSLYAVYRLLPKVKAAKVARSIRKDILKTGLPFLSVTSDRGPEFMALGAEFPDQAFVCDPYQPNQRGTNENQIGVLRQYIPKGKSADHLTQRKLAAFQDKLNHRPRKSLGYRTPYEVMHDCFPYVGSRS